MAQPTVRYRFGKFQLDVDGYELSRAGMKLAVRPKVFDILRYLLEHPDRLVTKQELLDALWTGQHVSETSVPWTIGHARRAIGQDSSESSPIETVHGRGYRWRGTIEVDGSEAPGSAALGPPFVGRAALLATLGARLLEARSGRGGLGLLVGDAGIGKTRCLDELSVVARAQGFSVWSGPNAQDTLTPVYFPFIQLLRAASLDSPRQPELSVLIARLSANDAGEARPMGRDAVLSRMALFEAVSTFLVETGKHTPLLLVLDDMHWADAGSIELLAFIAAELRNARVLVLAAARVPLTLYRGAQGALEPMRHVERFDLEPLTLESVTQYLSVLIGERTPEPSLCEAVHRVSAGYPLFLQETSSGLLAKYGRAALAALPVGLVQPSTHARDLLRAKLRALPEATCRALECASVLGDGFVVSDLCKLLSVCVSELLSALDAAAECDFVIPDGANAYRFRHSLFREVVYEQMPSVDRARFHRSAAHMRERGPDAAQRTSEIAYHYHRSLALGDYAAVRASAIAAANAASRAQSFMDAAQFHAWALEALARDSAASTREYAELLFQRALAQRAGGSPEDARASLEPLVKIAAEHGYADLLVGAARALRLSHMAGPIPDPLARQALERTLEVLPEADDDLRVQALSLLSWLPPDAHDMQRSKQHSERALELARRSKSRETLAEALTARCFALGGPDDIDALLTVSDEMLALDDEPRGWISVEGYTARHCALLHRGDLDGADAVLAANTRLANTRGFVELRWHLERHRAQRRFQAGDFVAAKAEFVRLEAAASDIGLRAGAVLGGLHRAVMLLVTRGPCAFTLGARPEFYREQLLQLPSFASLRANIGRLAVLCDQTEPARQILDEASAGDFAGVPKDLGYLHTLCNLALIAINLGDRSRCERLYGLLEPYAAFNTPNSLGFYDGPVAHFLGLLAAHLGLDGAAERYFAQAIELSERLGLRPTLARSCYEAARWALRAGRRPEAAAWRSRALALSDDVGMHWLAEQARALSAC